MRRRLLQALVAVITTGLTTTACDFDGAYDLPLPGSPVDADHSYEVTAHFADILNVVPRSPVMVDDVTVGEVTEVERSGWNAVVTLRIRDDVVLPDNAIADHGYDFLYAWHVPAFVFVTGFLSQKFAYTRPVRAGDRLTILYLPEQPQVHVAYRCAAFEARR